MSIRRQGWEWAISDLGNLPAKIKQLEVGPQSVFYSGFGDATQVNRIRTGDDEYFFLQYVGSTSGGGAVLTTKVVIGNPVVLSISASAQPLIIKP